MGALLDNAVYLEGDFFINIHIRILIKTAFLWSRVCYNLGKKVRVSDLRMYRVDRFVMEMNFKNVAQ